MEVIDDIGHMDLLLDELRQGVVVVKPHPLNGIRGIEIAQGMHSEFRNMDHSRHHIRDRDADMVERQTLR